MIYRKSFLRLSLHRLTCGIIKQDKNIATKLFRAFDRAGEAVFQHHRLRGFHRETDGGIGRNVVTGLADQKFKRQFRRIGDFITPFGRTNRMPCKARLDELREQIGASDQYTIKIGQRPARFDCFAHPQREYVRGRKELSSAAGPAPHRSGRRSAGGCRNWTYRPLRVR